MTEPGVPDPVLSPLRIERFEIRSLGGSADELQLRFAAMPGTSTIVALPTRDGPKPHGTYAGEIGLMVGEPSNGIREAGRGMGQLTLGARRLFGVITQGAALGKQCDVDRRGNGSVVAFTIARALFSRCKAIETGAWRKRIRAVSLIGGPCTVTLEPVARLSESGRFVSVVPDSVRVEAEKWIW